MEKVATATDIGPRTLIAPLVRVFGQWQWTPPPPRRRRCSEGQRRTVQPGLVKGKSVARLLFIGEVFNRHSCTMSKGALCSVLFPFKVCFLFS